MKNHPHNFDSYKIELYKVKNELKDEFLCDINSH